MCESRSIAFSNHASLLVLIYIIPPSLLLFNSCYPSSASQYVPSLALPAYPTRAEGYAPLLFCRLSHSAFLLPANLPLTIPCLLRNRLLRSMSFRRPLLFARAATMSQFPGLHTSRHNHQLTPGY